jgi:hypothetical protein
MGLFALVALSAYFAQSVRASMCLPGMDMGPTAAEVSVAHAGMDHSAERSEPVPTDGPHCPDWMNDMGSSCVVMMLPALTPPTVAGFEADARGPLFVDDLHGLLLPPTQFRPPRS